jgi:hypothetical protein
MVVRLLAEMTRNAKPRGSNGKDGRPARLHREPARGAGCQKDVKIEGTNWMIYCK